MTLCNAAGVHDASTAELALTLTLASIRDIPEFVGSQHQGRWEPLRHLPDLIVPFKRPVYEQVVQEFARFAKG